MDTLPGLGDAPPLLEHLEPVAIEVVRVCQFKKKPGRQRGCARCGRPKKDAAHFGAPPSVNEFVSGSGSGNAMKYANVKGLWQALWIEKLESAGLPKGLRKVLVEGQATFPDRRARDQGNHRFMAEKTLGDALQEGGWLEDDSWDFYEFGGFGYRYEAGVSATRLMIFASR